MTAKASTRGGPYTGPPGDATTYWLPRDMAAWEAAWAAHHGVAAPEPLDVTRRSGHAEDPGPADPEAKRRHDEAMAYVRGYAGTWGLPLDIRANPRFGTARFRLSDRQVEVLLAGRDRDLERAARDEIASDLWHDDEYKRYVEGLIALGNAVAEALEPGVTTAHKPTTGTVDEGMYRLPDGAIAKVQRAVHGSHQLYAKQLDTDTGLFDYVPGLIRRLRPEHRMTVEEAGAFGLLYGRCIVCGRTLTDEKSIAAGIGPVCASRV